MPFGNSTACARCLTRLGNHEAILDGEIVCCAPDGRPKYYTLLFRRGDPMYYAFDILWLDGVDLRCLPLLERKRRLKKLLPRQDQHIRYVSHFEGRGCDLFQEVCQQDLEGIVAKPANSPYGENWLKIKNRDYSQNVGRRETFDRFRTPAETPRHAF